MSVHALWAPLPNLFSSSQGLGLEPESTSSLPLVSNPPPALIPGWCRSLQQPSCPCLSSAKTTAGASHPAMGSLQFCLQVQVSLAPGWVLGWQQCNLKLENSILNPNNELLTLSHSRNFTVQSASLLGILFEFVAAGNLEVGGK